MKMRLIDADELIRIPRKDKAVIGSLADIKDIEDIVNTVPTIEAEPVKHGKWIKDGSEYPIELHCSVCGEDAVCERNSWGDPELYFRSDYCPNCGAKMDGGNENDSRRNN